MKAWHSALFVLTFCSFYRLHMWNALCTGFHTVCVVIYLYLEKKIILSGVSSWSMFCLQSYHKHVLHASPTTKCVHLVCWHPYVCPSVLYETFAWSSSIVRFCFDKHANGKVILRWRSEKHAKWHSYDALGWGQGNSELFGTKVVVFGPSRSYKPVFFSFFDRSLSSTTAFHAQSLAKSLPVTFSQRRKCTSSDRRHDRSIETPMRCVG